MEKREGRSRLKKRWTDEKKATSVPRLEKGGGEGQFFSQRKKGTNLSREVGQPLRGGGKGKEFLPRKRKRGKKGPDQEERDAVFP